MRLQWLPCPCLPNKLCLNSLEDFLKAILPVALQFLEYIRHNPLRAKIFQLGFLLPKQRVGGSGQAYKQKLPPQNPNVFCRKYHKYSFLRRAKFPNPKDAMSFVLDIYRSRFSFELNVKLSAVETSKKSYRLRWNGQHY